MSGNSDWKAAVEEKQHDQENKAAIEKKKIKNKDKKALKIYAFFIVVLVLLISVLFFLVKKVIDYFRNLRNQEQIVQQIELI